MSPLMNPCSGAYECQDLNSENEVEEECCDEQPFEDPLTSTDEEVQVANEVQYSKLSLEEVEKRLEIGQMVKDVDMAYGLYCKYANLKGFSVRRGRGIPFKDGSGLLQGKFFLCSCEGVKNDVCSKNRVPEYQKLSFRCNCKAKLKIARRKGDVWKVTTFVKEHTHELYAADETYLLRSGRNLTDEQELMLATMVKSGIPAFKAFGYLESAANGREHVGFLRKDALNCLSKANRKTKVANGDSLELVEHFIEKSNNETDFYWKMEVDDDQRLMNFFFRDHHSRIDYESFGDLISFDTTYRTNKYHMVCAPFVGINHHNENVLFGFALMSDETERSFEWLFKEFLKSMGGKQPGVIFTDQCTAMMNAIDTVFPDAHHRLCQWHIKRNCPSHMGDLNEDPTFQSLWVKCMNYCESVEEFEATWKHMVDNYNIGSDTWFSGMYKIRHRWATVFSDHIFNAGLLATSRSEGTNSALKKKIGNSTSSLLNCVHSYENVLNSWRKDEKEKDIIGRHNKLSLSVSSNPLLQCAAKVYTVNIYKLFEKELMDTMGFELPQQFSSVDSSLICFQVKSYGQCSRIRIVQYDPQALEIKCSCHKFETEGILCSHSLKVFDALNMRYIPEKYIRKRWTKGAKIGAYEDQCNGREKGGSHTNQNYAYEMAFVTHATKEVRDIAMKAKAHGETRDILSKHIACAKEEIVVWTANLCLNNSGACDGLAAGKENTPLVCDPVTAKSRGITNIQKCHWDDKRKKKKGKAESSKQKQAVKRKNQSSQTLKDDQPFKDVAFGSSQGILPVQTLSPMIPGIGGNSRMIIGGNIPSVYPLGEFNCNMTQEIQNWWPHT